MSSLLHKYRSALYLALLLLCFAATATYSFQVAQADYPSQPPSYDGGGGNDNDGDSSYDGAYSPSSGGSPSPDVRSCSANGATYVSNGDGTYSRYDSNGNSTGNVSGSFVQQHGDSSGPGSGCSGGCSGGSNSVDTSNDGIASN